MQFKDLKIIEPIFSLVPKFNLGTRGTG